MLARRMWSIGQNRYQVIAIDCDQVLWSGDCEAGPVTLDDARQALHKAVLQQRDTGMLLCLSGVASEGRVWSAFDGLPAMALQRDDVVAAALGGKTRVESLRTLAEELGLGLDSFIYLHSDPDAASEIEAACPGPLTLQIPANADEIPGWLKHVWAFDARPAIGMPRVKQAYRGGNSQ
jgi:predicted enzyme involved in methoxymalonyl-ACP biosynthesis